MIIRAALVAMLVVLPVLAVPSSARAADPASVRRDIERIYAVKVLGIRRISRGERRLFSVRVMAPGSDDNDAWQVNELLVDPASGRMVSGFQHRTSGYDFGGPGEKKPKARADGSRLIRVPIPKTGRSLPVLRRANGDASGPAGENAPATDNR